MVKSFITKFFESSQIKTILNSVREILLWELFLQKGLIVLFEIFLKDLFFEKRDGKWTDILPTMTKHCNIRIHYSTMLTPIQASLKKNEGFANNILLDKRKKMKPKFQVNDLVRTADLKKTFSKRDTTNWFYKLYKITETIIDTIPIIKLTI